MLVPSIDLQNGRVVQLVQGERLALASDDLDGWIERFRRFPIVQVIDLDAAMGRGSNDMLVRRVCGELPCQVGGGVRSVERAQALVASGARRIIVGSAFYTADGVDLAAAQTFAGAVGRDRVIAAVDARGDQVTIHGWKTTLPIAPADAAAALSPHAGGFLYTHVDTEGTMAGLKIDAVLAVRRATDRRVIAAGGIRSLAEVEQLDALGIDAVVGMAIYTGRIDLDSVRRARRTGSAT
jgi:phosphoribosylformimino-5-aminoimidazole carboxamide ribotide isomerase